MCVFGITRNTQWGKGLNEPGDEKKVQWLDYGCSHCLCIFNAKYRIDMSNVLGWQQIRVILMEQRHHMPLKTSWIQRYFSNVFIIMAVNILRIMFWSIHYLEMSAFNKCQKKKRKKILWKTFQQIVGKMSHGVWWAMKYLLWFLKVEQKLEF